MARRGVLLRMNSQASFFSKLLLSSEAEEEEEEAGKSGLGKQQRVTDK